jgi:hypothetical protein
MIIKEVIVIIRIELQPEFEEVEGMKKVVGLDVKR